MKDKKKPSKWWNQNAKSKIKTRNCTSASSATAGNSEISSWNVGICVWLFFFSLFFFYFIFIPINFMVFYVWLEFVWFSLIFSAIKFLHRLVRLKSIEIGMIGTSLCEWYVCAVYVSYCGFHCRRTCDRNRIESIRTSINLKRNLFRYFYTKPK